jgi:hypothetical protein
MRDPIEEAGPGPPPCEWNYARRQWQHPRFPSGDCIVCGALNTESCKYTDSCKYEGYAAWERYQTEEELDG